MRFGFTGKLALATLATTVTLAASSARADIIRCTFTEPFYSYFYSMAQQRLTITGPENFRRVYNNIGFQILGRGRFVIGDVRSPWIRLTLNYRGSDGMSDFVYPYTASARNPRGGERITGGCESNFLRRRMRTTSPSETTPTPPTEPAQPPTENTGPAEAPTNA